MNISWIVAASCLLSTGCGWRLETREPPAQHLESTERQTSRPLAPGFSLPNDDGSFVSLDELLADRRPAVLVFYRGHW